MGTETDSSLGLTLKVAQKSEGVKGLVKNVLELVVRELGVVVLTTDVVVKNKRYRNVLTKKENCTTCSCKSDWCS